MAKAKGGARNQPGAVGELAGPANVSQASVDRMAVTVGHLSDLSRTGMGDRASREVDRQRNAGMFQVYSWAARALNENGIAGFRTVVRRLPEWRTDAGRTAASRESPLTRARGRGMLRAVRAIDAYIRTSL